MNPNTILYFLFLYNLFLNEEYEVLVLLSLRKRRCNKYYRSSEWRNGVVENDLDIQFQEDFKLTRAELDKITSIFSQYNLYLPKVKFRIALLIFMEYTTSVCTFRKLARTFGKSTNFCRTAIKYVVNTIFPRNGEFIKLPVFSEMEELSMGFRELGNIEGTIMAIDGTHIEISAPNTYPEKYYNYKGYYSLNWLMGCDHRGKIRYVFGPGFGSSNDAFVFRMSGLVEWLNFDVPEGFHIIGDGAYPLLSKLLRPYKGQLTNDQKVFNKRICKQRRKVENAFGFFKNKFRRFRNCVVNGEKDFQIKIFITAIVINNILIG